MARPPLPDHALAAEAARWHTQFGWRSLLLFASLGLILEGLLGLKVGAYVDVSNDTRRLMWRLAHAHGALLGLIHVAYGLSLQSGVLGPADAARRNLTLTAAAVLLPAGFFLGGIQFYSGDPGLGIALVPVGALALLVALFQIARRA